jgi:CHAT domain
MVLRTVPKLRIEIAQDGHSLDIQPAYGKAENVKWKMKEESVREYWEELRSTLLEIKEHIKAIKRLGRNLTVLDASEMLAVLNDRGNSTLGRLFEKAEQDKIFDIFQKAFPGWRSSSEPIKITAATRGDQLLPIEFLPLFEVGFWPITEDFKLFTEAVRRFPVFSTIVQRQFLDLKVNQNVVLENNPKLPLRCFFHQGLEGANAEVSFFKNNDSHIDLSGPWPTDLLPKEEFTTTIASHLRYGNHTFEGTQRDYVDQVQHFTCHCKVDKPSSNSELQLSKGNNVRIFELESKFFILKRKHPEPTTRNAPLIFLNACDSAVNIPMSVTSFPRFFLGDNENRGLIGTEIGVLDDYAAEFSKAFYSSLLQGNSLGKAVYDAKWKLIREKNNPLGIAYTIYADPDLHVSTPVTDFD